MAETLTPGQVADLFQPGHSAGQRVLIRQAGRVLSAWDAGMDDSDDEAIANGRIVFGGPPAPDVGDVIDSWVLRGDVEVISSDELEEMHVARAADEAARPVFGLGERGEIVVAPDGSTVLRAEDMRDSRPLAFARTVLDGIHSTPIEPVEPVDDPSLGYRAARGVVQGDEPAEDIIRRLRDGEVDGFNRLLDAAMDKYAERQAILDEPDDDETVRQVAMRRRTLARFARDYAQAFEDGEDSDLLGMLENNLQVTVRRVLELTDP